jgi:glycopeptide antibiotics resistance protein
MAVCIILWFTVLDRTPSANHNLIFALDPASDEFIREMVLNVFLYVPLGIALPYALASVSKHACASASSSANAEFLGSAQARAGLHIINALKHHPRTTTAALAFTFIIIIECWQFITGSGVA